MSTINYQDWFYKYHKYINGNRNGLITYNDTKWKTINDRLLPLVKSGSQLIDEQPFMVVGNNYGFDKLLNLMQDSDYTFDDINNALIETYKFNYKNAMSRMVVNTHAVICSVKSTNNKYVTYDPASKYYVIDVPYDQMHFGERDEFIRQRLHDMHVKSTNKWIHISELTNTPLYSGILDFSILITMNGLISNDCMVAFDDHGLMFKVRWRKPIDFECIVYKLDTSKVYSFMLEPNKLNGGNVLIPWKDTGYEGFDDTTLSGLVDIYYEGLIGSVDVPGNFCYIDKEGIHIPQLQSATSNMVTENVRLGNVRVVIYELKYFFEIPNIYPAMNYFNMLNKSIVETIDGEPVTADGDTIKTSTNRVDYTVDICTPPIVIDRDNSQSHRVFINVLYDADTIKDLSRRVELVGAELRNVNENSDAWYVDIAIVKPIESIFHAVSIARSNYLKFAALTSLVEQKSINKFEKIYNDVKLVYDNRIDWINLESIRPDTFYNGTFKTYVNDIYSVLENEMFNTLILFNQITNNFIIPAEPTRFNRPVSEQCFIVMKYDVEEKVWLFCNPNIKHFNGIQNSFYIDTNLKGDEIFKFFVLYTDTEAAGEPNVEPMTGETVFDFDKFCTEIHKHQGYIRYWSAENKLLKISEVLFDDYDGTTCVNVMSKMLKHRIDDELLKQYPSDINYELSGVTTLGTPDEDSLESPFTINYLFYTINLFYNNNDNFLSYFLYRLTHDHHSERYIDIDITSVLNRNDESSVNYSYFYTAPNTVSGELESGVYHQLPFVVQGSAIVNTPYRYVFNSYGNFVRYPLIKENEIDGSKYVQYPDITTAGAVKNSYHDDIKACQLLTEYMSTVHDYMSDFMTNYETSFNQMKLYGLLKDRIYKLKVKADNKLRYPEYMNPDTEQVIRLVFGPFYEQTNKIYETVNALWTITNDMVNNIDFNNRIVSIYRFIQEFNSDIKSVYYNYGFKDYAKPRVRKMYLHFKKINQTMNLFEFKEWASQIDYELIANIEDYVSDNTLYDKPRFTQYQSTFENIRMTLAQSIPNLESTFASLINEYRLQFIRLRNFVYDIIQHYIFDMYRMNVDYEPQTVGDEPKYAKFTLTAGAHTTHPVTGDVVNDVDIILYPKYEYDGTTYTVVALYPVCEYAFFDGTPIDNVQVEVITASGSSYVSADITFSRVGSSSDIADPISLLNELNNTKVDVQNIHETFNVVDGQIVNRKYTDMHYELLIGNRFNQLSHVSELVLNRNTRLPGSIDRIYAPNQMINEYAVGNYGEHTSARMYFKPSQVLHIPTDDDVITSVYGPYVVGQKIYLETADYEYRFPVIVTSIDHSQSHGFLEAKVDDCEWLEVADLLKIQDYLFNDIECHVIPDNVSNFLNEYNDTSLGSYNIIELSEIPYEEMFYFPGDPIFVQNNANYVYTRLNWFIGDNIDNRFIDDEHKQYQFKYIGEFQIYETDISQMPYMDNVDHYYDCLRYLTPTQWYDFEYDHPLPIILNSIGDEHEVIMNLEIHTNTNEIQLSGPDTAGSLDNRTIYIVFKRIDGTPVQADPSTGYALPATILGTSQDTYPEDPVFMLGVYNQDDSNYNNIMFFGGRGSDVSDPWTKSIISTISANDYHVACLTFERGESAGQTVRLVSLYIDGALIDTIEHDYLFYNRIGIAQLVTAYGDPYVIFGNGGQMHTKFIATASSVHTDAMIQANSEWLYDRFINPATKQTEPIYDSFRVNMINHNVNPMTLSEIYPILRSEPDDHDVWDNEIETFNAQKEIGINKTRDLEMYKAGVIEEYTQATTIYDKVRLKNIIDEYDLKIDYWAKYVERMNRYIRNLETPSTWYNIGSYNAALVYIDNGRASQVTNSFVECITDLPYTDKLELYMYDYQNHEWIDPSDYIVSTTIVDGVKFDNPNDFETNNVLHSIDVQLHSAHITQKLLVYVGFNKSDIFTDIELNPPTCNVRFKPFLSINDHIDADIYSEINVRKHFDGYEYYRYTEDNLPNDIDKAYILEGFLVERPDPNGKYTSNPVYRFKDITINNRPYSEFEFYVPFKFKDVTTTQSSDYNTYECTVNVPVDSYQTSTRMTAICVEPDMFNGNLSTLTFELISGDDSDNQSFTVKRCSSDHLDEGDYICSILSSSSAYKSCGGLITISVTKNENNELKCGNWVKLNNPMYHIIPKRFIVSCPSKGGFPYNLIIRDIYYNLQSKWLYPDNSLPDDPYKYYYNSKKHVRYPISDTRHNDHTRRLAINTDTNPNIELVKSPYVGICRYSLDTIPSDGIIDMTGHIPTPLTRDRYEFWVNGRCLNDSKSLHIISPTSIQLCNLNSLRNFECVELVDDMFDSDILPHGNVYIDLYGNYYHTNTYESFLKMMLSNRYIIDQRIDYLFYNLQHSDLFEYTKHVISNPNNHDVEANILDGLILDNTNDYRRFIHQPSINGVTLYNLSVKELGLREVDNNKILAMYDKLWKHEAVVNPYIPLHHKSDILNIPVIKYSIDIDNDCYRIKVAGQYDGFFTIYISSSDSADISDVDNTIQIIPFVNCGTEIILDNISKYKKKYVCTTAYSQPVKLN